MRSALEEDVGSGDYSTLWSVPESHNSRGQVISRAGGLIAGIPVVRCLLEQFDPAPELVSAVPDGQAVTAGQVVAELTGRTRAILMVERTMLNFLQRLSGVATLARRFVDQIEGTGVKILDTRKTTPGMRELDKYAVKVGGGSNHRYGLYDYVLLKENHITAAGGITEAMQAVRSANDKGLPVEVEVSTLNDVDEALKAGVSRIMLDNMTIEQMKIAVEMIRGYRGGPIPEIEASGDVNLRTVAEIAGTGVDFISVGALTHSAGILNLTMLIKPEN
ncbi:MAG: carboxylating nicotinate-nucleotide diphosphorylase [Candidatus Glassbacteria bacterium]|nr:carboxylating nicotinate-nucleotide diphosphorylase [Candidatus Glassbacteria bacterium]